MKIVVEQSALVAATARVASVVEARNTIAILSNLLIDATPDGEVWLTATDLDIEIRARMDAKVEADGQVCVGASSLSEIARNAPKGAEVSLVHDTAKDPRLQVRFGKSRYQLPVLPAEDFPVFGERIDDTAMSVPAGELAGLLSRTHFAQSTETTRYYLNGTALQIVAVDGVAMLRTIATDGHRLALDECPAPEGASMAAIIVPRKTVAEIRRLLDGLAASVDVRTSPKGITVRTDDVRLSSKVIDGHFPDYERVIPRRWAREIEIDRAVLTGAVKRVSLISGDKARTVKFTLDDGVLALTVNNMETGTAREEIEIVDDGALFETGFNSKYVLDALGQSEGKSVVLRLPESGGDPGRLDPHPSDSAAAGALCVLMPVRV